MGLCHCSINCHLHPFEKVFVLPTRPHLRPQETTALFALEADFNQLLLRHVRTSCSL